MFCIADARTTMLYHKVSLPRDSILYYIPVSIEKPILVLTKYTQLFIHQ